MKISRLRLKGFSLLITVVFLIAVVLLNILAGMLTERFFLKIDLTETGIFTISDRATEFLSDINETVDIVVLSEESAWQANNTFSLLINTFQNYSAATGGRLRVQYVNPDLNSFIGPNYNNSLSDLKAAHTELEDMSRNDVIFISSRRATLVPAINFFSQSQDNMGRSMLTGVRTDQEMVSALTYVLNENIAHIVFINNHQEDPSDYINLVFDRSGYISSTLNLALEEIPDDTILLVSAAPKSDFLDEEIVKLERFLAFGGNVMILYDFHTQSLPRLDAFLAQWGIVVENKLVFDEEFTFIPQLGVIGAHVVSGALPSTENAEIITTNSIPMGIFLARPMSNLWADGSRGGIQLHPMISTFSASSYSKDIGDGGIQTAERESGDASGPFVLAYNASLMTRDSDGNQTNANLIVGNASMFDDMFLSMYASTFYNPMLLADLANDLNPFGEHVFIPPRALSDSQLLMSIAGTRNVLIFMVIALPLAIIAAGVFVWRKRRHK